MAVNIVHATGVALFRHRQLLLWFSCGGNCRCTLGDIEDFSRITFLSN
jgi:hypothetical protein